jgi:hypothetical protein
MIYITSLCFEVPTDNKIIKYFGALHLPVPPKTFLYKSYSVLHLLTEYPLTSDSQKL